jgi:hypothetical protein
MLAFSVLCPTTPPSSSTLSPSPALFIPITGASSSHLSFSSQALSPASRSADQATYQHLHFGVIQTVTIDTPKPAPLGHHLRKWDHSPSSCTIRIQLLPPLTPKVPQVLWSPACCLPTLGPHALLPPPLKPGWAISCLYSWHSRCQLITCSFHLSFPRQQQQMVSLQCLKPVNGFPKLQDPVVCCGLHLFLFHSWQWFKIIWLGV